MRAQPRKTRVPRSASDPHVTRLRTSFVVVLFWSLLGVVYATQVLLMPRPASERALSWAAVVWSSAYYVAWAPVTLLIWRVSRGWDLEQLGVRSFLLRHAGLALVAGLGQAMLVVVVAIAISVMPGREPFGYLFWTYLRSRIHTQLLIYAAIVATGQALTFHQRYRERQVAAAQLETQLAEARLLTLRSQLQPHFLFNSLHSIASLARSGDNAGVVRLISGFSDLLRHLLDTRAAHLTVREELDLVDRYLDLQRVRFGDRLAVRIKATQDAQSARVPLLIVQPLVENALRHGLSSRVQPGSISIGVKRIGDALVIEVADDGAGLPAGWSPDESPGTGLRNLRSRLTAEFGSRGTLELHAIPTGGVLAVVRIPYIPA